MAQLIITDDNPRERSFLAEVLISFSPILTSNAQETYQAIKGQDEPWIVTDIQMPEINGIEMARTIWKQQSYARILFWSHHSDETYIRELSKLIPPETVYGYVLKNNSSETLLRAANAVFNECQCWIDPLVRSVQVRSQKHKEALSDAEYDVLIDIALGLTDNTIAERRYLSRRGVQNRLQSLYIKIGANNKPISNKNDSEILNIRSRTISLAVQRGLINATELKKEEKLLSKWFNSRPI